MSLFQKMNFTSHAGLALDFKIECDALDDEDLATIAFLLSSRVPLFGTVLGIPRGGLRLAEHMVQYATPGDKAILVVDDVYTTGASMTEQLHRFPSSIVLGAVIFARNPTPHWITPLFTMSSYQPLPQPGEPIMNLLVNESTQKP